MSSGGSEAAKVKKRKEDELKMAAFIAQNTSSKASSQLSGLVDDIGHSTNKLGRTKASMIVKNVLAPSNWKDLIAQAAACGEAIFSRH